MTFYTPKIFLIVASALFLASITETSSYNLFPNVVEEHKRELKAKKLSKTKMSKSPRPAKKTKMLNKLEESNAKVPKTREAKKLKDPLVINFGNVTDKKAKEVKKSREPSVLDSGTDIVKKMKEGKKSEEIFISEFGTPLKKKSKVPFTSTKAPKAVGKAKTTVSKAPRPLKTKKASSIEKN